MSTDIRIYLNGQTSGVGRDYESDIRVTVVANGPEGYDGNRLQVSVTSFPRPFVVIPKRVSEASNPSNPVSLKAKYQPIPIESVRPLYAALTAEGLQPISVVSTAPLYTALAEAGLNKQIVQQIFERAEEISGMNLWTEER